MHHLQPNLPQQLVSIIFKVNCFTIIAVPTLQPIQGLCGRGPESLQLAIPKVRRRTITVELYSLLTGKTNGSNTACLGVFEHPGIHEY